MYNFRFEFYRPGKKYFGGQEFVDTLNRLKGYDYDIQFHPNDPHIDHKKNTISFNRRETELDVSLIKEGRFIDLLLNPAEGEFGSIGLLAMPEEQFDEQFKNDQQRTAQILSEVAFAVFMVIKPLFAWGDHELELDKLEESLSFKRVGAVAWNNFYSKELVDKMGGLDKVILRPGIPEERTAAQKMLKDLQFYSLTLTENPTKDLTPGIALECRNRYPGALLKSFEIPAKNGIEVW